jgi:hypothetical protein
MPPSLDVPILLPKPSSCQGRAAGDGLAEGGVVREARARSRMIFRGAGVSEDFEQALTMSRQNDRLIYKL